MEKNLPTKKFRKSKHLKITTSLDKDTLTKIKKKHKAWKRYMQCRTSENYREYCTLRNKVRKLTKAARKAQEKEIAAESKSNPKKFWSYVNNKTKTRPGVANLYKSNSTN